MRLNVGDAVIWFVEAKCIVGKAKPPE